MTTLAAGSPSRAQQRTDEMTASVVGFSRGQIDALSKLNSYDAGKIACLVKDIPIPIMEPIQLLDSSRAVTPCEIAEKLIGIRSGGNWGIFAIRPNCSR